MIPESVAACPTIQTLFHAACQTPEFRRIPSENPIVDRSLPIQKSRVKLLAANTPGFHMTVDRARTTIGMATLAVKRSVQARVAIQRDLPSRATVPLEPLLPEIVTNRFDSRRKCVSTQRESAPMRTIAATITAAEPF